VAIAKIEESLFSRAVGMSITRKKIVQSQNGSTRKEITEEELPPDPGAAKILLTNWAPEDYSDRIKAELTGKDGGPLKVLASPEWIKTRDAILEAVKDNPEARQRVIDALNKRLSE
jgi:hypothetical protein